MIDVLMEETEPQYVSFELDAGWCAAVGYDPVEFVEKYNGRVKLIHVKDRSRLWILAACRGMKTEHRFFQKSRKRKWLSGY